MRKELASLWAWFRGWKTRYQVAFGGFLVFALLTAVPTSEGGEGGGSSRPSTTPTAVLARVTTTPSVTPTPQAPTPSRTPTPAPCPTAAQSAYLLETGKAILGYSSGYGHMATQANQVAKSPVLMFDDAWKLRMAVALAEIQLAADTHLAVPTAAGMEALDSGLDAVARDSKRAIQLYAQGLDDFNVDFINQGNALVSSITLRVPALQQQIERFCG